MTTPPRAAVATTAWAGLLDDAALFPPGEAPMARAVPDHRAHRAGSRTTMVGPFLVPAARLGSLLAVLDEQPDAATLDVGVIAPVEDLPDALEAVTADPRLTLRAGEVALSGASSGQVLDTLRRHLPAGVTAAVEIPRDERRPGFLDALAGTGMRAKLRTGGVVAPAFPPAPELAAAITGCRDRGVGFKATAGLHRAVHHTDPGTGFVHHGYLNLLLAADAAAVGGDEAEVAAALTLTDAGAVAAAAAAVGPGSPRWWAARALFASFGTCSIHEPTADLEALGLLGPDAPEDLR